MSEVWAAIGTVVVILFGVWRMLAHYEARNDAAHANLAQRTDNLREAVNAQIDKVNARIDKVNARIDRLYELLSARNS